MMIASGQYASHSDSDWPANSNGYAHRLEHSIESILSSVCHPTVKSTLLGRFQTEVWVATICTKSRRMCNMRKIPKVCRFPGWKVRLEMGIRATLSVVFPMLSFITIQNFAKRTSMACAHPISALSTTSGSYVTSQVMSSRS